MTEAVIWHDLECGAYSADLALWRELAARASPAGTGAAVLDIGAGSGRVTLDLARRGHRVSALDLDPRLLAALEERAAGLPVRTLCADARGFRLEPTDHALCLVPMQTIQLLRGPADRAGLLESARAHLRPGSAIACAIVTHVEAFDCMDGSLGPSPEHARVGGKLYLSRAVRVQVEERFIRIERERLIAPAGRTAGDPPVSAPARNVIEPARSLVRAEQDIAGPERNVVELERIAATQLCEEALEIGLSPQPTVAIAETVDHAGSEVVMLRA